MDQSTVQGNRHQLILNLHCIIYVRVHSIVGTLGFLAAILGAVCAPGTVVSATHESAFTLVVRVAVAFALLAETRSAIAAGTFSTFAGLSADLVCATDLLLGTVCVFGARS